MDYTYFQMGSAAMDALKYSNYMSGLYGSMATSGTTNTDPTNTTSTGNKSPYSQMQPQDSSATGLSPKSPYESNNGSANSNPLKSNYSADSLSRSYFDGSRYVQSFILPSLFIQSPTYFNFQIRGQILYTRFNGR